MIINFYYWCLTNPSNEYDQSNPSWFIGLFRLIDVTCRQPRYQSRNTDASATFETLLVKHLWKQVYSQSSQTPREMSFGNCMVFPVFCYMWKKLHIKVWYNHDREVFLFNNQKHMHIINSLDRFCPANIPNSCFREMRYIFCQLLTCLLALCLWSKRWQW